MEVKHDCPYCNITERHPGIHITAWDNTVMHIAVVTCDSDEGLMDFQRELSAELEYDVVSRQANRLEVVIRDRNVDPDSVTSLISRCDCWCPAIGGEKGWSATGVLLGQGKPIQAGGSDLGERGHGPRRLGEAPRSSVLHEDMMVPVSNVLNGLTQRQADALINALERGYYDSPARVSADELAKALGLSRSTLSEHLRKAEARLLLNVLPMVRMAREEMED